MRAMAGDADSPREASGIGRAPAVDLAAARARSRVAKALFGAAATEGTRSGRIGRYEIRSRLGAGGMGVVYEAWDPQLQRAVAIKVLHPSVAADDKARQRLTREARALARLSHPHVIGVYDVGVDDERVFIAMELVDGETLTQWLAREPRPWREALRMLIAAGQGLAAAHDVDLVHRDFKPDNVLIARDGRVRVLDFGLARSTDERHAGPVPASAHSAHPSPREPTDEAFDPTLTDAGAIMGTPLYMSPEQLIDGHAVSRASDQYSFCVAVYEAVYGQRPFAGTSLPSMIANAAAGRLQAPPGDSPIPAPLFAALRRGLAQAPAKRWPSMGALLARLASVERGEAARPSWRGRVWFAAAACLAVVGGTVVWRPALDPPGASAGPPRGRSGPAAEPAAATEGQAEAVVLSAPTNAAATGSEMVTVVRAPDAPMSPRSRERAPALAVSPASVRSDAASGGRKAHVESPATTVAGLRGPSPRRGGGAASRYCHVHEDTYVLLARRARGAAMLRHAGACYACRSETRRARIERIGLACGHYLVCGEVPATQCD
ncbi:MAG: hypothetical protein B7733_14980 [Myxococcales bacterium FL481]|nr:MAG: hypothetical protein B7733_14980 [Myxococcales bacterium FL481]